MTAVEFVTVTVSCIAIGASIVSLLLFVLYSMLQRRLILTERGSKLPEETASIIRLFAESLKDDVPDDHSQVLRALIRRYSETSLTSVLDNPTEKSYLFQAVTNPETLPWKSEGQREKRSTEG